jgi:hypothetical protein
MKNVILKWKAEMADEVYPWGVACDVYLNADYQISRVMYNYMELKWHVQQ